MEIVGYKLIKVDDGSIIRQWGGTWGQCPAVPNPLELPNGDIVCSPEVDVNYSGYRMTAWEIEQPSPIVPSSVPMWAVRTILQNHDLFEQADTLINSSSDNALKNIWNYGNFADRGSIYIQSLASQLQLTNEQVDQLFLEAGSLQ